jgi:uncharacterized protein (DUF983 family)
MPMPDLHKDGMDAKLDCSLLPLTAMSPLIHVLLICVAIVLLSLMRSATMEPQMPIFLMLAEPTARLLVAEMALLTPVKSVMVNNFAPQSAQLLFWDT